MNVPAGHHAVCLHCGGTGKHERPRAAVAAGSVRLGTEWVRERCRPCDATGWIPPKYPPADSDDAPDQTLE